MEMKMNVIQEYFDLIQNKIVEGGFFLNVNRYLKRTVGEDIYFYKYPYDEKWHVVISEKNFLQDHVCFFLTIRKKVVGNIKEELKKIEIITQNQKFFIIKRNLINLLTSPIKNIFYLIIKKVLIILFGKKKINKVAKILYNISFK